MKRNFREETAALNRLSIQTVGAWLGTTLPNRGSARCPFPQHEDRNPSFEVKASGRRWICYGCNRRGGPIDFVMAHLGVDFPEAKRWLAAKARIAPSSPPTQQSRARKAPATTLQNDTTVESSPDYELYEAFLTLCPLQPPGREYLIQRGLSQNTIVVFKVGQLVNNATTLRKLLGVYGFERINSAGFLTTKSTPRDVRLVFPEGSLVFPFLENNHIVYLQARAPESATIGGKWRNPNYRKRRIYNVDALLKKTVNPIAVCEGIMDTLSAVELGYNAIGMMGVSAKIAPEQMVQLRGKEVNILLDWDAAGEGRSGELQTEMRRFGITSTRKARPSPTAKDLNEYLVELRTRR